MLEHGKYYHIYNRGNNRENLFLEHRNYEYFLTLYQRHIEPIADTFAYCLMKNHFHLLIRIKDNEEVKGLATLQKLGKSLDPTQQFKNFFIAYSKAINNAFDRTGALFEYPFKKIEISSNLYFTKLIYYIHFNPQKHTLISHFRKYPYSSYEILLSNRQTFLKRDFVLEWFGEKDGFIQFHNNVSEEKEILMLIDEDQ